MDDLNLLIIRANEWVLQKILSELSTRERVILYSLCKKGCKKRIEANVTSRAFTEMEKYSDFLFSKEEISDIESRVIKYFNENLLDLNDIDNEHQRDIYIRMKKKHAPQKFLSLVKNNKKFDSSDWFDLNNSWYGIFAIEKLYGFPKNTIFPAVRSTGVELCVLIDANEESNKSEIQEIVIGRIIPYAKIVLCVESYELTRLAEQIARNSNLVEESRNSSFNEKKDDWYYACKKMIDDYLADTQHQSLKQLLDQIIESGKNYIQKLSDLKLTIYFENGLYLNFTFSKDNVVIKLCPIYLEEEALIYDEKEKYDITFMFATSNIWRVGIPYYNLENRIIYFTDCIFTTAKQEDLLLKIYSTNLEE